MSRGSAGGVIDPPGQIGCRVSFKLVESLGVKGMQVGQNYQFTYQGCAAGRDSGFARRISKPYFVIYFFPPHNANEVPPPRADPSGLKATRGTIHVATNFTTRTIALTSSACCPKEMISEFSTLHEAKSVLAALESKSEALQTTRVPTEPDAAPMASAMRARISSRRAGSTARCTETALLQLLVL